MTHQEDNIVRSENQQQQYQNQEQQNNNSQNQNIQRNQNQQQQNQNQHQQNQNESQQQANVYQLKYMEERISATDIRLKEVEGMAKEFTKISTILEIQIEMNTKQDVVLGKINDNLTTLNHTSTTLGERVSDLEHEVKEVTSRDTISVSGLIKKVSWTVLSLTVGGFMAWMFKYVDIGK